MRRLSVAHSRHIAIASLFVCFRRVILLLTGLPVRGIGSADVVGDEGECDVAKAEWGVKRICTGCGARFYDMRRDPIICPKCEATIDPLAILRSQRSKAPAAAAPAVVKKPVPVVADADDAALVDDDVEVDDAVDLDTDDDAKVDDAADDTVLEDASELGEDKDDMFEVLDKVGGDGEEETR